MQTATKAHLKKAVHHNNASSRNGLLERLFTATFKGFVYNQIWEDPRVDAEGLKLGHGDKMLTISSGGCNVLNYLLYDPDQVNAIDLNTCHMSLTRLKLAALKHLPDYEAFFKFFGYGNDKVNVENYDKYIKDHLDPEARKFWEHRSLKDKVTRRRRINYFANGYYDYSKLGMFIKFLHTMLKVQGKNPQRMLEFKSQEEQIAFYEEVIEPIFDQKFVRMLANMRVTVYSLGIPPSQFDVMKEESEGKLYELYKERVRRLTCDFPMDDNYFAWQAFGRRYDLENRVAVPDYLKEENYELLRDRMDRITTNITTFHNFLSQREENSLNRFVLLDAQDWMPPEVIAELWTDIARVGAPGSRIIFRTSGSKSPIEESLPPELMSRFEYEEEKSKDWYAQDRSAIYGMFHAYEFKG